MRLAVLVSLILLWMSQGNAALAQAVEMAAKCDDAQKRLEELVKRPDVSHVQKIKDALGLDVLNSCSTAEGHIICYQCVDKDLNLRMLQLLQKKDTKRFEMLGFGCKCGDEK